MKRTTKATAKHLSPPAPTDAYLSFLARKAAVSPATGFEPSLPLNPALFPFQRDVVAWALRRGRAALFEDCFLPGTLIFADGAYRPIEECHENMAIETLFGASTIERTMSKNYDGEVVEVKTGSGFFPVTVTKDHKFYVLRRQQCVIGSRTNTHCSTACDRQCPAETKPHDGYRIELVAAKDLTLSDCLLFRQPREGHGAADASDAYLRLAGLWLAEGHLTRANGKLYGIHLSFCLDEEHTLVKDAVEALAQLGVRARIGRSKEKQNVLLVEASNHELATRLFEDFNELSHGKRLPAWFFRLVPEKQRILLRGLFEGDAHIRMAPPSASKAGKLSQFIKFVTVSYELASGVRDALLGMGVRCSALVDVAKTDKRGTNHRQAYRMLIARRFMGMFGYPVDVIRRDLRQVEHVEAGQTYTLIPVRALHKRHYKGPVYNLTSAGHDSYLTDAGVSKNCGMGKSLQQLEWARHVVAHTGKPVLILTPLAVAAQTEREAARFGIDAAVVEDASGIAHPRIYITNYEKLHKFNPADFGGVVLDESGILKAYDGKTRTQIIESFRHTPYKLACTATPAPNDHEELGNHAEFLGVMSRTEMLASFFCHDGGETQVWRLKGHAEGIFWAWVASWAVSLRSPADLGYEAAGFALPGLVMHRHLLPLDGFSNARGLLFETGDGFGLSERREARRASLAARVAKVAALVAAEPSEPWLIWCGLNAEGDAITKAIADAVQVAGADSAEDKTARMLGFSDGAVRVLVTKAGIAGFGMNWQHCARMIFAGMDDSYESFYQAVRRCYRFGQSREVQVHIVASEPEGIVIDNVLRKEREHMKMLGAMAEHARQVQIANVRGAQRETDPYRPSVKMTLPSWIASEVM